MMPGKKKDVGGVVDGAQDAKDSIAAATTGK